LKEDEYSANLPLGKLEKLDASLPLWLVFLNINLN
jgi:hypothetical protein